MPLITGSVTTYGTTTNRESLLDTVYRISPSDTPFMSAVPRSSATAVLHEWSTQALQAINTTNAALEGDDYQRAASTTPVRRSNVCQISKRNATVTGTQRAVNPAGIDDMMAHQMSLKSLELRRDMEAILLGNTGQNTGNATTARTLRSFNAWFAGNALRGTGGADSTAVTAAATDATAGSLRAFSEPLLVSAILAAYDDGGEPTMVLVGARNKQIFSTFTGRSTAREQVSVGRVQGAASIYASDFGDLKVVPNRSQRSRDVYVVDPTKVAVAFLRPFEVAEAGRIGDADTRELLAEYTLEMRHPDAHAMVADTNA